jgi:hypothetical protein
MVKIILLKTWIENMGNAIIDMGTYSCLSKAFPKSEIYEVSGYSNFLFEKTNPGDNVFYLDLYKTIINFPRILANNLRNGSPYQQNCLNVGELLDADFAVFPGCTLYEYALNKYLPTLEKLRKKNIEIIFLGAGGGNYEPSTINFIKKVFKKLKPKALITRDSDAFKNYSNDVKLSFNGIDCGFFINDWFKPPKIKDSFIASSFDKISEPEINTSEKIIRLHHHQFYHNEEFFQKPNTLISDNVKDYLTIYSNASETHSDRVHACVASLSYETPARLYFSSPRAKLFENITKKDITNELVKLDKKKINNLKREQIKIIKEVIIK